MARNLGVHPSQIEIVGYQTGSLVVKTKIRGLKDQDHANAMAAHVERKTSLAELLSKHHFGTTTLNHVAHKMRTASKAAQQLSVSPVAASRRHEQAWRCYW